MKYFSLERRKWCYIIIP